ncbi:hypothetical protein GGF43_000310 [Coemansia sp. RSA 2618]|nr:hypothetical protein GGF43_000310 [Coemansia sp. RSA 2618]
MKGAHKYVDQCTEIERTFMQLATTNDDDEEDRAGSSWVPLTSMKHPYPITVQGHTAKPFCFRIVFYAPTTPATAFDLLASILRRPEWDELTESTRIIEKLGPGDAIHYVKMKPVWPTAARDSLLLSHLTEVRVRGERAYLNVSKSIEDARVPEGSTRGVVRMEAGIAGQLVTRVDQGERQQLGLQGEHWCRVVQIADGDLKGWIPKSVIKFIATQALPRSLKKVCQQLAELPAHDESLILNPNSPPSPQQSQSQQQQQPTVTNTVNGGERQRGAVLQKAMVPMKTKMGRWSLWLRILAQYATPALVAVVTSLVFQIILGRRTGRRFW